MLCSCYQASSSCFRAIFFVENSFLARKKFFEKDRSSKGNGAECSLEIDDDKTDEHTDDDEERRHLGAIHQDRLRNDLPENNVEHGA